MQAGELMKGDWVYNPFPVSDKESIYAQIAGIDPDNKITFLLEENVKIVGEEKDLNPIPITPEILEKNDFITFGSKEYYLKGSISYTAYGKVDIKKNDSLNIWELEIHSLCFGECFAIIEYVHQLQHLLKQFGFEKKKIIL